MGGSTRRTEGAQRRLFLLRRGRVFILPMKPNFEEIALEWLVRATGHVPAGRERSLADELEKMWERGNQNGMGIKESYRTAFTRPARPEGEVASRPDRTPEEATAVEKKIEADIVSLHDRLYAALMGHGESVFARLVIVQVMARTYVHLMNEDPEVVAMLDEPTRSAIDTAVERVTANLIALHRAALEPHQN